MQQLLQFQNVILTLHMAVTSSRLSVSIKFDQALSDKRQDIWEKHDNMIYFVFNFSAIDKTQLAAA